MKKILSTRYLFWNQSFRVDPTFPKVSVVMNNQADTTISFSAHTKQYLRFNDGTDTIFSTVLVFSGRRIRIIDTAQITFSFIGDMLILYN